MIEPTVGRIVYYHAKDKPANLAAIVTGVINSRCVNLAVFGFSGDYNARTGVRLRQPDDECPGGNYCEWMPYQVKKDYGSESGEKEAGTKNIQPEAKMDVPVEEISPLI